MSTPDGLYLVSMGLPIDAKRTLTAESVISHLIQDTSPIGGEATHAELMYVVTCNGRNLVNGLCRFARACRHIRMDCEQCQCDQVYSGKSCPECDHRNVFRCNVGAQHTVNITARKWPGAYSRVNGAYISGVDVQLDRALIRGPDKLNRWDSYLAAARSSDTDKLVIEFCEGWLQALNSDSGANRYNYMSVLFNLCQVYTNPTAYYGRGRPLCRAAQCACWWLCCCVTDNSNPFFPSEEEISAMSNHELAAESFTCATMCHILLMRAGAMAPEDGGIVFGSVHPGQLVMVARAKRWKVGLLHDLLYVPERS